MFGRIAAAVLDSGGIMCHAAIVAREYGLPAVIGTGIGDEADQDRRSATRRRRLGRRRDPRLTAGTARSSAVGRSEWRGPWLQPLSSGETKNWPRSRRSSCASRTALAHSFSRARQGSARRSSGRRASKRRTNTPAVSSPATASRLRRHSPLQACPSCLRGVVREVAPGLVSPRRRALEVALLLAEPGDTAPDAHVIGLALLDVLQALCGARPRARCSRRRSVARPGLR